MSKNTTQDKVGLRLKQIKDKNSCLLLLKVRKHKKYPNSSSPMSSGGIMEWKEQEVCYICPSCKMSDSITAQNQLQ